MKHLRRIVLLSLIASAGVLLVGCPDGSLIWAFGGARIAVYSPDFLIDIEQGDVLDYGTVNQSAIGWLTFEIWNDGSEELELEVNQTDRVYVIGGDPALWNIWVGPYPDSSTIEPGENDTFDVNFDGVGTGESYLATVTIHTNDLLVPVFVFYVTYFAQV